jgi:hypothetical protein
MSSEWRRLTADNAEEIANWCGGRTVIQHSTQDDSAPPIIGVNVPVNDEVQRAQPDDYVVRSHYGKFFIKKIDRRLTQ